MVHEDPTPEDPAREETDPSEHAEALDDAAEPVPADAAAAADMAQAATGEPEPEDDNADNAVADAVAPDPVAEAERQRDEYLDHLRRERAEFENFRRRAAKERAEALDRGAEHIVANLLGVLDNFGFVLDAAKDSPDESLAKGAQMVYAELVDILGKAGLEQVPGEGEPFDPNHHEAMMEVEASEPVDHPVVEQVLRPGYRFKDRVLRPASVSVKQ